MSSFSFPFGFESSQLSPIQHEEAIVADVYRVEGKNLILKLCSKPYHFHREVTCLARMRDVIPVPLVVDQIPPDDTHQGALLMECLPGHLLSFQTASSSLLFDLGRYLALIHSVRFQGYGEVKQEEATSTPLPYLTTKLEESLAECEGHLETSLIDRCRDMAEAYGSKLHRLDGPCLAHRDYRPGNILVDGDQVAGIIDWAGARASFAEEDFRASWLLENQPHFFRGYSSIRPLPNFEPLLDYMRLQKALGMLGFTLKRGTWDRRDAHLYQHHLEQLYQLTKAR